MKSSFTVFAVLFLLLASNQNLLATIIVSGKIETHQNFPSKFVQPRNVQVWMPDGYSKDKKYRVLYMHDGQMLFDASTTWNKQEWGVDEIASRLISQEKVKEFILVAIFSLNPGRHSEYFPQKPMDSLSTKQQEALYKIIRSENNPLFSEKVNSDNYLRFLVEELKPFIDNNYSVLTDAKNTFIMGSSMGGLISMYAISEYPNIFGGAACLSTHWPGIMSMENNPVPEAFYQYMKKNLPAPDNHKFYFDHGNKTLDVYYAPLQLQVDEIMRSKGFSDKNWITKSFDGEEHSENAWKKRLHIPLLFLLGQ